MKLRFEVTPCYHSNEKKNQNNKQNTQTGQKPLTQGYEIPTGLLDQAALNASLPISACAVTTVVSLSPLHICSIFGNSVCLRKGKHPLSSQGNVVAEI